MKWETGVLIALGLLGLSAVIAFVAFIAWVIYVTPYFACLMEC